MTKRKSLVAIAGLLLILTIVATIKHNPKGPGSEESGTSFMDLPPSTSVKVYEEAGAWIYEIYVDTALYIYQDVIPGIPGNMKFTNRNDALKCGELVIKKLKAKQLPTIYPAELDSLGISY